jgi:hypothetical protein
VAVVRTESEHVEHRRGRQTQGHQILTPDGCRVPGPAIPKMVADVEAAYE